jgi:hypothetical protein
VDGLRNIGQFIFLEGFLIQGFVFSKKKNWANFELGKALRLSSKFVKG